MDVKNLESMSQGKKVKKPYVIFPSRISGKGYKIGPMTCVCLLISTLLDDRFDMQT